MLALPRHFSRMLNDVLDDDMHYWPLETLRQHRAGLPDLFQRDLAWPTTRNNKFNLDMDVRQYDPSEISVKLDNDMLEISGKHEKTTDGRYEFCEFRQKCNVPANVQMDQLKCKVDKDGYLKIEAPLKEPKKAVEDKSRDIPIQVVNRAQIKN